LKNNKQPLRKYQALNSAKKCSFVKNERQFFKLTVYVYLIIYDIRMEFYSSPQVAKKLGISFITLNRYIAAKKIPLPPLRVSGVRARLWREDDIENVRKVLPKIANGRKTRHKKKQSAISNQQSAKTKKKKKK
jgi:predicted DNA-binding transcriptional regulator AlpA